MLTFFRQIRQSLFMENKIKTYLKYAIGEIVLVVIGILIALQINNWNEERQRIEKEYEIMTNLAEDFKINLFNLEESIDSTYPAWTKLLQHTTDCFGKKENKLTDEDRNSIRTTSFYLTDIIDGSLNSILSSDKLELLRDPKLKSMITAYPAKIQRFKKLEGNLEHYVLDVQRDVLRNYVSLADRFNEDDPIKISAAKSDYEGLMNNLYYQNIIIGQLITVNRLTDQARDLSLATKEIYNQLLNNMQ
jgi:hypothetical protein